MAREFTRINIAIWQDDDWRALPPAAQHLYLTLWTHPKLSYAGVVDWRPGRLAAMAGGWTTDEVQAAGDCLEARLFIVKDEDSEECLIRSFVRFDGLMKQPRMAVSYANAFAEVSSSDVRGVIIHEAIKLRELDPMLPGWAKPQVLSMLGLAVTDPRSRPLPKDPFGDGFGDRFTPRFGASLGETLPKVSPRVSVPPTTATATATATSLRTVSRRAPRPTAADLDGFDEFWTEYPRREDKGHARTAWTKAAKKTDPATIILGAKKYAASVASSERKFIAMPATWLNGERWTDELAAPGPATPARGTGFWSKTAPTAVQP